MHDTAYFNLIVPSNVEAFLMATHLGSITFLMILTHALRYYSWMFELIQYLLFGINLSSRCFCFVSQLELLHQR